MSRIKSSRGALKGHGVALAGTVLSALMLILLPMLAILAGMLLPALARAKSRAQSIACANQLKQLGLGVRVFAIDHDGKFPSNWQVVSNEINNLTLFICPADGDHIPATSWATLGPANITYELSSPAEGEVNPSAAIAQCPIHGNILMADGSVQRAAPQGQRRLPPTRPRR
jgi:prepilin-type processing-associated H-X9-DG protein